MLLLFLSVLSFVSSSSEDDLHPLLEAALTQISSAKPDEDLSPPEEKCHIANEPPPSEFQLEVSRVMKRNILDIYNLDVGEPVYTRSLGLSENDFLCFTNNEEIAELSQHPLAHLGGEEGICHGMSVLVQTAFEHIDFTCEGSPLPNHGDLERFIGATELTLNGCQNQSVEIPGFCNLREFCEAYKSELATFATEINLRQTLNIGQGSLNEYRMNLPHLIQSRNRRHEQGQRGEERSRLYTDLFVATHEAIAHSENQEQAQSYMDQQLLEIRSRLDQGMTTNILRDNHIQTVFGMSVLPKNNSDGVVVFRLHTYDSAGKQPYQLVREFLNHDGVRFDYAPIDDSEVRYESFVDVEMDQNGNYLSLLGNYSRMFTNVIAPESQTCENAFSNGWVW